MSYSPASHQAERIDRISSTPKRENPLVSVIIPTYNHAHFVAEAIQSVRDQQYERYEIIVVDDGSTDDTREVVSQFGNKVRYIYQPNQGLSAARNTGLQFARGDLVGFLDADDLYESNYLSALVSLLSTNPRADAVHCACRFVDRFNNPLPQIAGRVIEPDQLYPTLLKGNFMTPLCMFVYRYCYDEAGPFDRAFQGVADWDMWLRISKSFNVVSSEKVLARYRVVPKSMSSNINHMLEDRLCVLRKHIGFDFSDQALLSKNQLDAFSRAYLTASVEYLQAADTRQAYQCLTQALHIYPGLVEHLDVFYELAWGSTPRGYRGDYASLELSHNAKVLMDMLERLFKETQISPDLKKNQKQAYANANFILGLLSYRVQDYQANRSYLIRAAKADPNYLYNKVFIKTFVKSFFGSCKESSVTVVK